MHNSKPPKTPRLKYLRQTPGHPLHGVYTSAGPNAAYLLISDGEGYTVREEYFCWLLARRYFTGLPTLSKARYMVYGYRTKPPVTQKYLDRVMQIVDKVDRGEFPAHLDPWLHYGYNIGYKNVVTKVPAEYGRRTKTSAFDVEGAEPPRNRQKSRSNSRGKTPQVDPTDGDVCKPPV